MTAPHPSAAAVRVPLDLIPWLLAQDELDLRADETRRLCASLSLSDALTSALVARAASPRVVRAAAQRFSDWLYSLPELHRTVDDILERRPWQRISCPEDHPDEAHAAGEIVATCIDDERMGRLERPCAQPCACGRVHRICEALCTTAARKVAA